MNIKDLLPKEKAVSTAVLFKSKQTKASVIQILEGEQLREHLTKIPAFLICVIGEVVYENENGLKETLQVGDYVQIEPMIKHWVNAIKFKAIPTMPSPPLNFHPTLLKTKTTPILFDQ